MKIEADTDKILDLMRKRGIKNKRQLADNCGIDFRLIYMMFARRSTSKETLWLISDELGVSINDIVVPNWEK